MSDIKDFSKNLKKALDEARKEAGKRENMQRLGDSVAKDIKKRTQLGYGVSGPGKNKERLLKLTKSTKDQRAGKLSFWTNSSGKAVPINTTGDLTDKQIQNNKAYIKKTSPRLSNNTSPGKSNLTRTGKMLKSIGALVTGVGRVSIGFRTSYGARIAAFVSKARPFFFMTSSEEKRTTKRIEKLIEENVKRSFRKYFK